MSTLQVSTVTSDVVTATQTVTVGVAATGNALLASGVVSGSPVTLTATGVDANISINLVPKGTGSVLVNGLPTSANSKLALFYFSNRN